MSLLNFYEASAFYSYTLSKDDIIFEVIYDYCEEHNIKKEDLNIVSFEDQEELTDLANQVWVNSSDGLTDENIASASGILKGKFNYTQALGRTKRHKANK